MTVAAHPWSMQSEEKISKIYIIIRIIFFTLLCSYWQIWSAPKPNGYCCVRCICNVLIASRRSIEIGIGLITCHRMPYCSPNTYRTVSAPDIYSTDRWFSKHFFLDSRHSVVDRENSMSLRSLRYWVLMDGEWLEWSDERTMTVTVTSQSCPGLALVGLWSGSGPALPRPASLSQMGVGTNQALRKTIR